MPKLKNLRHEMFAQEYSKHLNGLKSYRKVYPDASSDAAQSKSSDLVRNDKVRERISELIERRSAKVNISAETVLKSILEIRERCMKEESVFDRFGKTIGTRPLDPKTAMKANELLGKYLQMFNPTLNIRTNATLESLVEAARKSQNVIDVTAESRQIENKDER